MSSSSQPPYKSRLFNFLNRQYIRINAQIGKRTRQLKLTVEWSLQTLLYPFYLLVQAGRMVGRQFNANSQPTPWELEPANNDRSTSLPDSDSPIQKVLEAIATENILPQPKQLTVQGLAIMLTNRHLVLVSSDNQIYDLLSPQQQKDLQLLIRDVSADYWQQTRLVTGKINPKISTLPTIKSQQSELSLPLKLFWQLMGWVQKSRVAIACNLFGESSLISSPQSNYNSEVDNSEPVSPPTGFLANLDSSVAKLENVYFITWNKSNLTNSNNYKDIDSINNNNQLHLQEKEEVFSLQILIKSAIDYFFGRHKNQNEIKENSSSALAPIETNKKKNLSSPGSSSETSSLRRKDKNIINSLQEIVANVRNEKIKIISNKIQNQVNKIISRDFPENIEEQKDPFQIKNLIWAAIDYFFNQKNKKLSSPNNLLKNNPKNSNNILSPDNFVIEDPWLTWEDLYGNDTRPEEVDNKEKPEVKSNSLFPKSKQNNTQKIPKNKANIALVSESSVTRQKKSVAKPFGRQSQSSQPQTKSQAHPNLVKNNNSIPNSIEVNPEPQVNEVENQPDCLETQATDLGYDKHFLQIILEWLDKTILWLENLSIKIWRWLRRIR